MQHNKLLTSQYDTYSQDLFTLVSDKWLRSWLITMFMVHSFSNITINWPSDSFAILRFSQPTTADQKYKQQKQMPWSLWTDVCHLSRRLNLSASLSRLFLLQQSHWKVKVNGQSRNNHLLRIHLWFTTETFLQIFKFVSSKLCKWTLTYKETNISSTKEEDTKLD